MNDELRSLVDGYLDDCLSPEDFLRVDALLRESPEFAQLFARAALLHDRLHTELQGERELEPGLTDASRSRIDRRWTITSLMAIAAAIMVGFFFWHGGTATSASAASVALDRMIDAASQAVDRVYRILVTDPGPEGAAAPVFSGKNGRKPGIDGAELFVRGNDQFVLVRHFGDGTDFVTGSDGVIGWAVAPKGNVHLSHDPRRFRRAVPGEHEELTFTDFEAGFGELRRAYDLTLVPPDAAGAQGKAWSCLEAVRRGRYRGPERVRIWFDAAGVAHRIELEGLPEDEGRARGVVLELAGQRDLGAKFFTHEAHHAANRRVDWE